MQVDLQKKNWKEQIEKACSSALLFLRTGTCSVVKVAKLSMERDEIVENVVAAMEGVVEVLPKKWGVVRSFHVKLLESLALPVYQAVPDVRLKIEGVKDLEDKLVKDEKKVKDAKKSKKKGRIHEIKYMDDRMSSDGDDRSVDIDLDDDIDDDFVSGGGDKVDDDREIGDIESGGLVSKKRKKGVKKEDLSELGSVKSLKGSAKKKKKDGLNVNTAEEGFIEKSEKNKKSSVKEKGSKKKNNERGVAELAVKHALEEVLMFSGNESLVKDEGSDKKKRKTDDVKVKSKKSKKAV